ncbi:MAG: type II toxin-antitoxin system VapC family toxin [Roseiarcus sp.]|jgi:predicted nucleic-acid-binding protein
MIGLDTNILLRAVLDDDSRQSPLARGIIGSLTPEEPGVVNSVALAEFSWTLRSGYGFSGAEIAAVIRKMLDTRSYVFPDRDAIDDALLRCEADGLSFPDALIGEINRAFGCGVTLTFDEKAAKSSAFKRVV